MCAFFFVLLRLAQFQGFGFSNSLCNRSNLAALFCSFVYKQSTPSPEAGQTRAQIKPHMVNPDLLSLSLSLFLCLSLSLAIGLLLTIWSKIKHICITVVTHHYYNKKQKKNVYTINIFFVYLVSWCVCMCLKNTLRFCPYFHSRQHRHTQTHTVPIGSLH